MIEFRYTTIDGAAGSTRVADLDALCDYMDANLGLHVLQIEPDTDWHGSGPNPPRRAERRANRQEAIDRYAAQHGGR